MMIYILGGPFFKLSLSMNYILKIKKYHAIISHERLEADDCIAIATKHVLEK